MEAHDGAPGGSLPLPAAAPLPPSGQDRLAGPLGSDGLQPPPSFRQEQQGPNPPPTTPSSRGYDDCSHPSPQSSLQAHSWIGKDLPCQAGKPDGADTLNPCLEVSYRAWRESATSGRCNEVCGYYRPQAGAAGLPTVKVKSESATGVCPTELGSCSGSKASSSYDPSHLR